MGQIVFIIVLVLATAPITISGVWLARKHRRTMTTFATVLLVFGIGMRVDPPPPPTVETTERDDEEAPDDEPKDPRDAPSPDDRLRTTDATR